MKTEPKIQRDYRKQGNMFVVYQWNRLLAMFVFEAHAENFILDLFDRQTAASSANRLEPFMIKTEFIQIHG